MNDEHINNNSNTEPQIDNSLPNARNAKSNFGATPQIHTYISNSSIMMSHIIDRGIDIDEKLVETIVNAKQKIADNAWDKEIEIKFLLAYKELTKLIKPVTIDSLLSGAPGNQPSLIGKFFKKTTRTALSRRSVVGYTVTTLIGLIILLLVQIYFYLGSTRISNITNSYAEQEKILERQKELFVILENAPDNTMYNNELEDLNSRFSELDNIRQSNIDLLDPWSQYIRKITFNTTIRTDTIAKTDKAYIKANTAIIQEAKGYVLILGIYVLPLLYGIIGGFTFVLRELSTDIKSNTFTKESNIKYILRILLGSIAGLSVGLFWGDIENAQTLGLSSLSPLLLSFLGGYCVEYLLQLIEVIIQTFYNKFANSAKSNDKQDKPNNEQHNKKQN